jgi:hypothetical protein
MIVGSQTVKKLAQSAGFSAFQELVLNGSFDLRYLWCDTLLCSDIEKVFGAKNLEKGGFKWPKQK